jgi:hypothetical protein
VAPEPEPFADLVRWAILRYQEGDDIGAIAVQLAREAYNRGRRDRREGDPFEHEATPTVDVWGRERPSERPTAPPRGPTGTIPSLPAPPPMPRGVKKG